MKNATLEVIGMTIRRIRLAAGMTQEQLAEAADCHVNYISMVERGHRNPSALNLLFIARALRVHPSELFQDITEGRLRKLPPKSARRLRGGK